MLSNNSDNQDQVSFKFPENILFQTCEISTEFWQSRIINATEIKESESSAKRVVSKILRKFPRKITRFENSDHFRLSTSIRKYTLHKIHQTSKGNKHVRIVLTRNFNNPTVLS